MKRRVIVERDEVLPEPAHVRLAAWRARQPAVQEAEPVSWMTHYRAVRDAEQSAVLRALWAERDMLRKQLEPVVDARFLRATRALALVEDDAEAVA